MNNKTKCLCFINVSRKMFVEFANSHLRTPKGLMAIGISFLGMSVHMYLPQTKWVSNNVISSWEPFPYSHYGNNYYYFNEKKYFFCLFVFPFWGIPVILLPAKVGK